MELLNTTKYPVFEADQVLSQKHLNAIMDYLDQQDRVSRASLVGLGIVCGLEVSYPSKNQITIGCGTAITSLGYLINWSSKTFSYYHSIELSKQFLEPDYANEPHLDSIFKHSAFYKPLKNAIELLESDTKELDKKDIPNNFFDNTALMLLLETSLVDEKNCVSTNCDDKGKRIEFKIRPLLIDQITYNSIAKSEFKINQELDKIVFPRYNVPFTNLVTGSQVLDAFKKIFDDSYLTAIASKISLLYNNYQSSLKNSTDLSLLNNCKAQLLSIYNANKDSLNVQYLWDWLFDITAAYNEIIDFEKQNTFFCCAQKNQFPFHVIVEDTIKGSDTRTYFKKSGNTYREQNKLVQLQLLFERLNEIISNWAIKDVIIKITPSLLGKYDLSKKAIPFYYDDILTLNKKWNPKKTINKRNDEILSYHSEIAGYTNLPEIKKPLLFDMEPYNFFRIEGHIGKNYKTVLTEITAIKDTYNLPFNVLTLNAVDYTDKEIDISNYTGDWKDLEVDYDLAKKKIYNITAYVFKWIEQNKAKLLSETLMSETTITSLKNILDQLKSLLKEDLNDFIADYKSFYDIFKQTNILFLLHRYCITINRTSLTLLAEDFIDQLDQINNLFLEDPLTVIYETAINRWEEIYKEMFLSNFLINHKGIEHKAGVTKNGTFILVYADESVFKKVDKSPTAAHTALLNNLVSYNKLFNFGGNNDEIKSEITASVLLNKDKFSYTKPYNKDSFNECNEKTNSIKANLLQLANYNMNNYPKHVKDFFLANIDSLLQYETSDSNTSTVKQKVVLADFYLPYRFPTDGIINTIVNNETTPKDFDKLDFNNSDFNT